MRETTGHCVIGGRNYGQGSSREHAAIAPRNLGLRIVAAKSYARIHRRNLVNYGVLPLVFADPDDHDGLSRDDVLVAEDLKRLLQTGRTVPLIVKEGGRAIETEHHLTQKEIEVLLAGGLINWRRKAPAA